MLLFMVFLILCKVTYVTNKNVGSTLFTNIKTDMSCWSRDDIAKLQARKAFEAIIPPTVVPEKINKQYVKDTLMYFRSALRTIQQGVDNHTATILNEALSDTIGGHLKSEILPAVRLAYYAGYIPYGNAKEIHDFFEEIKTNLNTQGLGWKRPTPMLWSETSHLTVDKITIGSGKFLDPCSSLVTKRDVNKCIHLPTPTLDDIHEPSAMALPFKRNGLVNLKSPHAENILLKYYTIASRCILHNSPIKCRHADFVNLNSGLWHWMKREVAPHLVDENLYAAYGGVLRIAAAVQNYGKGLSRRNIFEYHGASTKWNPWRTLSQTYIYANTDWSPAVYVGIVFLIALAICSLQVCYNYMFGEVNFCRCKGNSGQSSVKEIGYSMIDSDFPAALPQHSTTSSSKVTRKIRSCITQQPISDTNTHKVYDLNENKEKVMSIILCGRDNSDTDSSTSKIDTDEDCEEKSEISANESRTKSPPKIETTIAQLTIDKQRSSRSDKKVVKPMYSTSTLTHSDVVFCQEPRLSESVWSGSSSTTSGKSASSTSSKSRSHRSRRSRDIVWARHVISRHSQRDVHFSGAELDSHSFTTPPSRR